MSTTLHFLLFPPKKKRKKNGVITTYKTWLMKYNMKSIIDMPALAYCLSTKSSVEQKWKLQRPFMLYFNDCEYGSIQQLSFLAACIHRLLKILNSRNDCLLTCVKVNKTEEMIWY